jgi:dGTPase
VGMSDEVHQALLALRDFLYARVYESPAVRGEFVKTAKVLRDLHTHFLADGGRELRGLWVPRREGESLERAVVDFLCGMTDRYAIEIYRQIFLPSGWEA